MKSNKICLLIMLMALSAYNISAEVNAQGAAENQQAAVEAEEESIKANKDTLERASEAIAKKDYQSAIVLLTAYINSKPKKYEAYKLRGEAFYALRQYKLAQRDYQTAVNLKADDDKFITGTKVLGAVVLGADKSEQYQNPELGNLYAGLMYSQKALNNPAYEVSYQKAVEYNSHIYLPQPKKEDIAKINCPQKYGKVFNPQGVDSYIYGAIGDIENGNFHEAVYKTQYITSNYPKYYLGHYLTGVAMVGLEQSQNAITAFNNALKYNPYDFESFASLGQIYYNQAEKTFSTEAADKSVEYFNKALKYNPNCYMYFYYIGLNNMLKGDYDLAISNFNTAIKYKSNDYNSQYYKLIAQYIKGDYNSVVEGATRLLYRHVSNYNSVLYLRALAYNKLGNTNAAIADLEKVHANMNDIYNADIKNLSKKEKTLEPYLYYLQAEILRKNGFGTKVDLAKAFKNPIIAELDKGKGFENSQLRLSASDVENQYDYIRTAFADLGVSFEYLNPDYKFIALKSQAKTDMVEVVPAESADGIEKAQESVNIEDSSVAEALAQEHTTVESIEKEQMPAGLKLSTDPMDTLSSEDKTSIAQILASQSLNAVQNKTSEIKVEDVVKDIEPAEEAVSKAETVESTEKVETVLSDESSAEEHVKAETPEIIARAPVQTEEKPDLDESRSAKIKSESEPESEIVVFDPDTIIFTAPVQKESETFDIKYDEPILEDKIVPEVGQKIEETATEIEQVAEEEAKTAVVEKVEKVQPLEVIAEETLAEKKSDEVSEIKVETLVKSIEVVQKAAEDESSKIAVQPEKVVKPVKAGSKPEQKIVEKHANVDLTEFNVPAKITPEIKEDDDVVILEPNSFIKQAEQVLASDSYSLKNPNKLTDDFSRLKQESESVEIDESQNESTPVTAAEFQTRISEPSMIEVKEIDTPELNEEIQAVEESKPSEISENTEISEVEIEDNTIIEDGKLTKSENAEQAFEPDISPAVLEALAADSAKAKKEKAKKEKRVKVKKEKELKDFLNKDETVTAEKPAKIKKETSLKDFLNDSADIPAVKNETSKEVEESGLKEFLNDSEPIAKDIQDNQKSKDVKDVEEIESIEEIQEVQDIENIQSEPEKIKKERNWRFWRRNKMAKVEKIDDIEAVEAVEVAVPVDGVKEPVQEDVLQVETETAEQPVSLTETESTVEPEQKPKKSFWSIFKRNKKAKVETVDESEISLPAEPIESNDEVSAEKTEEISENLPVIRQDRPEFSEEELQTFEKEVNDSVKPEKKKFNWFRRKKDVKTEKSKPKRKFSWKEFFSKESGDNSEVYVKTPSEKKVIKEIKK